MKVSIEFDCDNAAFEDNFEAEMGNTLFQVIYKIQQQLDRNNKGVLCTHLESADKLLDSYGNTIGTVKVNTEDDHND